MTFRYKGTIIGSGIVAGFVTLVVGGYMLFVALTGKIADPTFTIPLLSVGPAFFLIMCAVFLPQKLVWQNGVLQKYVFGRPAWRVDVYRQSICVQPRAYRLTIYFRLVYEQDGKKYKRDIKNIDSVSELYTQMLPFHDEALFLDSQALFALAGKVVVLDRTRKRK